MQMSGSSGGNLYVVPTRVCSVWRRQLRPAPCNEGCGRGKPGLLWNNKGGGVNQSRQQRLLGGALARVARAVSVGRGSGGWWGKKTLTAGQAEQRAHRRVAPRDTWELCGMLGTEEENGFGWQLDDKGQSRAPEDFE